MSYLAGRTISERAVNFLSAFREVHLLALAVTLTNVGGVAYGVYYYWQQLLATPWYLLPFVPDSPSGPFFMIVIFGLWWFGGHKRAPALELLAFVALVKYGVWTVIVMIMYRDFFFAPGNSQLSSMLIGFHFGEALEAGILLKGMRMPRVVGLAAIAAWFAVGDYTDYVLDTHPRIPQGLDVDKWLLPLMTVSLSFICYVLAVLWCRRAAREAAPARTPAAEAG